MPRRQGGPEALTHRPCRDAAAPRRGKRNPPSSTPLNKSGVAKIRALPRRAEPALLYAARGPAADPPTSPLVRRRQGALSMAPFPPERLAGVSLLGHRRNAATPHRRGASTPAAAGLLYQTRAVKIEGARVMKPPRRRRSSSQIRPGLRQQPSVTSALRDETSTDHGPAPGRGAAAGPPRRPRRRR